MISGPAPADLRPLTALRFFAAAWVAVYAFWPNLDVGFVPTLVTKGYLGVEVFFVLSGFILSHVYLEAVGHKRFRYAGFLWARLARVYPLHLATLIGVGVLGVAAVALGMAIDGNILSWPSLPANLLLLHAWGLAPQAGWNHSSWSISAEWFAYLAFPVFAVVAWRLKDRPRLAVAGAAVFMIALYAAFEAVAGFSLTEATILWGALRIVPCFALGCALYLLHRRVALPGAAWIATLCVCGMAAAGSAGAPDGVVVLLGGGLILALAALPNTGWLASRPAVYLGEISYAVYMVLVPWQLLAVNLAARLTGAEDKKLQLFVWLAVVLALPLVAAAAYHLVEHPARRALRGLADRRAARRKPAEPLNQLA
ncbi:acyltransferase [Brevundimonas sp. LM2]|uniref:acyltransferase family protein n=1 Tax=Brevundimonas sp. LM2 TaxID=1938605 RepID=UPI000983ADCD|nr:acyltransferase [Brevundimonas sp. LM2]AQR60356.1 acyltransferase [Brevundimonas sp. LM2]